MKTKLHYVFSLALILIGFSVFGQQNYFTKIENANRINQVKLDSNILPTKFDTYSINLDGFRNELIKAPQRGENYLNTDLILEFPNLEGKMERYQIFEASVMHPELQAKYPEIRSYAGYGIDTKATYLRFSISPYKGISGIILSSETNQTMIIDPLAGDATKMILFNRSDKSIKKDSFVCSTIDEIQGQAINTENRVLSADATLHTFDLALSVTGEYSAYHGGTKVLANVAMANTMARVNGVFERDFNVTMVLIANNDLVVYTDGLTDPYSDPSIGAAVPGGTWGAELQANLTVVITESGYDIGHLFGDTGGGGNAGCIGCICVDGSKGSAFTSPGNGIPEGDTFDIDYVAHEMGHQFGGNHTFTHQSESPSATIAQMEPGSGSTIMGYAGITGATDVQPNSDPYFHAISIQQITAHVASRTCDDETTIVNNVPVANAGGSPITLPIGTPFELTGSATDGDSGDMLTYCWEQFDENDGAGGGFPDETSINSDLPLFRSYNPTSSPTRTFPELQSLLDNGVNGNTWEKVPTGPRSADFRLTVRDNKAGGAANDFDDIVVNWDIAYGPFAVTSQNTPNSIVWTQLTSETITWDVLNTDGLAGAANVNILLSIDGGLTYTETLKANTPNDGTELITVPNVEAPYCRIKIEPVSNQFFAINTAAFAIGNYTYGGGETCTNYVFNAGIAVPEDAGSYAGYGLTIPDSGTITDLDINVDITHNDNSDLYYAWIHPSQASGFQALASGLCPGAVDVDLTFDDEGSAINCSSTANGDNVIPEDPLSFADGLDLLGDWTFLITDVIVGDGDIATWNSVTLTICVGGIEPVLAINELVVDNLFSIYPNPNSGEFSIQVNSSSSNNILVEVYDLRGRLILNKSYNNSGSFNEKLNLGNVQSGMYLVNVSDGSRKSTKKIMIN